MFKQYLIVWKKTSKSAHKKKSKIRHHLKCLLDVGLQATFRVWRSNREPPIKLFFYPSFQLVKSEISHVQKHNCLIGNCFALVLPIFVKFRVWCMCIWQMPSVFRRWVRYLLWLWFYRDANWERHNTDNVFCGWRFLFCSRLGALETLPVTYLWA